ncbi:MAG: hypothetical protein KAY24_12595 [Candidatus Eisenbacteria sp.]|nr:hypothetical protein [Candidatus Eisenbacteria bacterium]
MLRAKQARIALLGALLLGAQAFAVVGRAAATPAETELSIRLTIGAEGDDVVLHRPAHLTWSADGSAFLLNTGDCSVLKFDRNWALQDTFGRRGEGPGEIMNPRGLLVVAHEIWVVLPLLIQKFDLSGTFVGTVPVQEGFSAPILIRDQILALGESSARVAVCLNEQGTPTETFGPSCNREDHATNHIQCGFWQILPAARARCLLLDRFTGRGRYITLSGEMTASLDLGLGDGNASSAQSDFDVVYAQPVVASACAARNGYLVVPVPKKEGDAPVLRYYDSAFTDFCDIPLPSDMIPYELHISPSGDLCVVDTWSSVLYICDLPDCRN